MLTTNNKALRLSSYSTTNAEESFEEFENRYRWQSAFEYIYTSVMYSVTVGNYLIPNPPTVGNPNIIQFCATTFLIGMPLQYMQTALGQYSQRSVIFVRHLAPLGHGLGYSLLLISAVHIIKHVVATADYFVYFVNSLQKDLPWFNCRKSYGDKCWNGTECLTKCLIKDHTAAYCYWNYTYMNVIPEEPSFKRFSIRRPLIVFLFLVIIYFIVLNVKSVADRRIRNVTYASIFGMGCVLFGIIIHNPTISGSQFMGFFFDAKWEHFVDVSAWYKAVWESILYMNLGFGGHVLLGSYMAPSTHTGIYVASSALGYLIFTILIMLVPKSSRATLATRANLTGEEVKFIYAHPEESLRLTLFPATLKYMFLPHVWGVIYFASCMIGSVAYIVINIKVITLSMLEIHPNVVNYQKYILFAYLLFSFIASIGMTVEGLFYYSQVQAINSMASINVLLAFLFTIICCFTYGVDRLCDDLHFIVGDPPSRFIRMIWFVIPIVVFAVAVITVSNLIKTQSWFGLLCMLIYIMPTIVMGIVETFKYAKMKHLAGVFRADDQWGVPSFYLREKRIQFNPVKEVRCTNQNYRCRHKCLLNSELMRKIIRAENEFHHLYPEEYLHSKIQ